MFKYSSLTVLAVSMLCSAVALAKAPASAPAGSTGMCKDGSYTTAASKSGACSGHDGVKKWYGAAADASAAPAAASPDATASSGSGKSKSKSKADAAAAPAAAPAAMAASAGAVTGTCKDGTTTSAASKSGACSGHGGVKQWGAAAATDGAAAGAMTKAAPAMPATTAAPAKAASSAPAAMTATPGGGAGQVWVNKPSKVYHCPNDQWYGKTKDGAYMTEASAIAQGYHADHGKACQ
jgi:Protein of unknown function (DUF3761)